MFKGTHTEIELLDALLNFTVPVIPPETRFWMVRTQKGYFYDEFLAKKFIALAWNNIDQTTDFSEQNKEFLCDSIVIDYPEINRPSVVINKCYNFIHTVKPGDIIVIPNKGSNLITFAEVGEYYEDAAKTVDLEHTVINRIRHKDVDINDVSCPYKKRRKISILRTVRSEDIHYSLYRAISNYHGISNFDDYSMQILNTLYNCYTFKDMIVLVYNIRKKTPIKPREISQLMYSNIECLSAIIDEEHISTQITLNSPGEAVYILEGAFSWIKDNWNLFFGLLIFLGGGSALSFRVSGLIDILKNIINAPSEIKIKKLEAESKELELLEKRIDIYNKLKSSGINPEDFEEKLGILHNCTQSLESEPIILGETSSILSSEVVEEQLSETDYDQ